MVAMMAPPTPKRHWAPTPDTRSHPSSAISPLRHVAACRPRGRRSVDVEQSQHARRVICPLVGNQVAHALPISSHGVVAQYLSPGARRAALEEGGRVLEDAALVR